MEQMLCGEYLLCVQVVGHGGWLGKYLFMDLAFIYAL